MAIELDGGYHNTDKQLDYDIAWQRLIESLNIKAVRFYNAEFFYDLFPVITKI